MMRRVYPLTLVPLLLYASLASVQEHSPVMEKIA